MSNVISPPSAGCCSATTLISPAITGGLKVKAGTAPLGGGDRESLQ
jgi:hypothetical protein